MHDISDLEARGVVGVFVASAAFVQAAAVQSESLGFDAASVFVPHPIQDRTDDEMQRYADEAFEQILKSITAA